MANAQSVTTFVMAAQLPWPDDAPAADAMGSLDPVALLSAGQRRDGAIRRISPRHNDPRCLHANARRRGRD